MTVKKIYFVFIALVAAFQINAQGLNNFVLEVTSPSSIAGEYELLASLEVGRRCIGNGLSGPLTLATDGTASTSCNPIVTDLVDQIAFIDRGSCNFDIKALNAENKGAIAVIICNNEDTDDLIGILAGDNAADVTIPVFSIRTGDCATIKADITNAMGTLKAVVGGGYTDPNPADQEIFTERFFGGFNGWENVSLRCATSGNTSDALWEWRDRGDIGQGGFVPEGFTMFSDSPCDGLIIFDSDRLDSGGSEDTPGAGTCPSDQEAYIQSPSIDLSAADANAVFALKFTSQARQFRSEFWIGWSTDGGANWEEKQIYEGVAANDTGNGIERHVLAGVSNSDNLRVRFRFSGDYYYWAIDDVQIVSVSGVDAELNYAFYTPLSYAVPSIHADADPFLFAAGINNLGAVEITNPVLKVEVLDTAGNVYHTDQITVSNIAISDADTFSINPDNLYLPTGLEPGPYIMRFSVEVSEDQDPSNNIFEHRFEITENVFAKEVTDPLESANRFCGTDPSCGIGAAYIMSPNVDNVFAEKLSFSFAAENGVLTDNYVDMWLLKMRPGFEYPFGGDFDRNESDLGSHPAFEVAWNDTYVFTTEQNFDLIEVDIRQGDDFVALEKGATYVAFLTLDNFQGPNAQQSNNNLFWVNNPDIDASGIYLFYPEDQNSAWYTGFSGGTPAPIIRLQVGLNSADDDIPLAEGVFRSFPNPAQDYVNAELNFEEPTDAVIILADISGRILQTVDIQKATRHLERVDISGYAEGSYLIRVATEEGSKTHKFVITKQ